MLRRTTSGTVVSLACVCALAAGCVPSLKGNEPREASKETPATFRGAADDGGAAAAEATSAAQKTFGELFSSVDLRTLIDAALKNNRELNSQLQEIIIAQNEVSARQGEYLPKVNAGAGVGVEKVGKYTSSGASDEATGLPQNLGNFTFGLTGSWEVDIWKRLRNGAKAAGFRQLATVEGKNFMTTQIVAEIARSYFELIALDNRIEILNRNIEIQTNGLEVVKLQKLAARVTELAVQRFEADLLKNKSRLYDFEQERVQAENRINFLVGRFPQPIRRNPGEFRGALPEGIATGLPAQLLDNRPDVRRAAFELEAAKLDVQVAKTLFYPSLSIEAGVGYRSFNSAHIVTTPESLVYNAAGNLTAPLLNRTAITAQYRSANAKQLQAVFEYEKTLLQAFTDVSNQLSLIENLHKSYELQSKQVDALTNSVEVSNILFRSARADYMEVLTTRRDSLEAQMDLIETKKRQFLAIVNVYQSLGGGWRTGT